MRKNKMDTISLINRFKLNGFMNAGKLALSSEESSELGKLSREVYDQILPDHPDHLSAEDGAGGVRGIPQHHPRIAELLNRVVSNPDVQSILESVLGPSYKIWQINFRRSLPTDKGLQLHQDGRGQVNICILLSENNEGDGATVFLPSTHLVQERIRELKLEASPGIFKLLGSLITPLTGKVGDIGFLFNRTWHGRSPNASDKFHDIIMIGFYPAGAHLSLMAPYLNWSKEFLQSIQGTRMGYLMDPSIGTELESDGRYRILAQDNTTSKSIPFSLEIETYPGKNQYQNNYKLRFSIIFLKIAMGTGRPFKRLYRKMIGSIA